MNFARLMLFVEAFPARTYRSLAKAEVSTGLDLACGLSSSASFAKYDPDTSSWRTSQRSVFGGWTEYSEVWPTSGTMRDGECFQQKTWEHHICESDCLLWPTPSARQFNYSESVEAWDKRREELRLKKCNGNGAGRMLNIETRRGLKKERSHERTSPEWVEALMGFPVGWTGL